jgi:hypothetical protein
MKRALVALIAGTVLSGLAAAYASTGQAVERPDTKAEATRLAGG